MVNTGNVFSFICTKMFTKIYLKVVDTDYKQLPSIDIQQNLITSKFNGLIENLRRIQTSIKGK